MNGLGRAGSVSTPGEGERTIEEVRTIEELRGVEGDSVVVGDTLVLRHKIRGDSGGSRVDKIGFYCQFRNSWPRRYPQGKQKLIDLKPCLDKPVSAEQQVGAIYIIA